jgi:hypothetical protein
LWWSRRDLSRDFEIGRVLHFKFENGKLKSDLVDIGICRAWEAGELQQRLIDFGARTTRVARMLPKTIEGRYISQQLMRSGLAAAPNYAEARRATPISFTRCESF